MKRSDWGSKKERKKPHPNPPKGENCDAEQFSNHQIFLKNKKNLIFFVFKKKAPIFALKFANIFFRI
jgi:hypothetical protein